MHDDALLTAAALLGSPAIEALAVLPGSDRNRVWRARLADDRTVVVKHYRDPSLGTWRRESAALRLADGEGAPRILAVSDPSDGPAVTVLEDLGDPGSLADLLLARGADAPRRAGEGLVAWATAIGRLQHRTHGRGEEFATALGPGLRADAVAEEVEEAPTGLAALVAAHDLPWSDAVPAAFAEAVAPLTDPADAVLSPGDACPDNNLLAEDGARLLDFEYAQVRHRAWDAAYLRVPWPSCWCAWQVPADHAHRALASMLEASYGGGPVPTSFAADLDAATLLWCLVSVRWFLPGALEEPAARNADEDRRPGRWTMVITRLELAARTPGPEPLRRWAAETAAQLVRRWGEHALRPAPAYR